jgi:hypothetical protein
MATEVNESPSPGSEGKFDQCLTYGGQFIRKAPTIHSREATRCYGPKSGDPHMRYRFPKVLMLNCLLAG